MPAEYIYVLARGKSPLMPTTKHSHVQKLLRKGKARVAHGIQGGIRAGGIQTEAGK